MEIRLNEKEELIYEIQVGDLFHSKKKGYFILSKVTLGNFMLASLGKEDFWNAYSTWEIAIEYLNDDIDEGLLIHYPQDKYGLQLTELQ